jgi:hypothetical protein
MDANTKLVSISDAAKILDVHQETLRRWDKEGTLKSIRLNGTGDRKYRLSDLMAFSKSSPELVKYDDPIEYNDCKIFWDSYGMIDIPGRFGVIGKIIVEKKDEHSFTGFAFASSGLQQLTNAITSTDLEEKVLSKVKYFIDNNLLTDEDTYNFELLGNDFFSIENPEWWEGKYSKTLVQGLRLEASHTVQVAMGRQAWRVILRFKSKSDKIWYISTFGENNNFSEYYVWVDGKELQLKDLPVTAKGAEILAMEYLINRFNETKGSNGNRSILKIKESNAACFNGTCIKNMLLPEEL